MLNKIFNQGSSKAKKFIIVAIALLVLLPQIVRLNPFFTVEYGTLGVVSQWGKIVRLAKPGLNVKLPVVEKVDFYSTQKVIYETSENPVESPYYNNQVRKNSLFSSESQKFVSDSADYAVDTTTKDGQQVSIRFTLRYALDPEKILWIAEKIGTQDQVAQRIVQAETRSVARNLAREFTAAELYTGNVLMYQIKVAETLKTSFINNGVLLDEFLVRQMKFSDQYIASLEQKQIEMERVKTEEFIAQQEEFKKQQKIIKAEGESKAQEILRLTIDPLVLQKMAIEKWNGALPTYFGSSSALPFINLK